MISVDDLRQSSLLRNMETETLQALMRLMQPRSFPGGALLFCKGDPGESMILIQQGQVRVFLSDGRGNEITLRTLGAGHILGEFALLDHKPRTASAAALTPLIVLELERAKFLALLHEQPLVGVELMRSLAERIRYSTTYLERLHDAIELLSNNEYDEAIREIALSTDEDEMQKLIAAFIAMVRSVQARTQK